MGHPNQSLSHIFVYAFIALVMLSACSTSEPASLPTSPDIPAPPESDLAAPSGSPEQSAQVDDLLAAYVTADSPGAAVIVIREGRILHMAGYGLANLENRVPVTPRTIFHMASTGKQFTGLAIMMLAEQGLLTYDDPISRHLPELSASFGDQVTIRHLLHHTGGIPEYYDELLGQMDEPTNEDMLVLFSEWGELELTPGETFSYSNPGYELLGSIVERVSGQSLGDFMQEHVFAPLNMRNTFSYEPARLDDPNRALGYEALDSRFEVYDADPLDRIVGSGSIYSTVEDLYRYDQALYTDQLVKQTTLQEAFMPARLNDGSELNYGFGWVLGTYRGLSVTTHDGAWVGFTAYYARFPDQHLSVIVLANRTDIDVETLTFNIADVYL